MATLVSDTFTDPDNTGLPVHTPDVHPAGTSWAVLGGAGSIQLDKAQQTSGTYTDWVADIDAGAADATGSCTIRGVADSFSLLGIICRITDASNYWVGAASPDRSLLYVYENNASTFTQRASAAWTGSAGVDYTLQVVTSGTSITVSIGASSATYGTMATGAGKTPWGFLLNINGSTVDNFLVTSGGAAAVWVAQMTFDHVPRGTQLVAY